MRQISTAHNFRVILLTFLIQHQFRSISRPIIAFRKWKHSLSESKPVRGLLAGSPSIWLISVTRCVDWIVSHPKARTRKPISLRSAPGYGSDDARFQCSRLRAGQTLGAIHANGGLL